MLNKLSCNQFHHKIIKEFNYRNPVISITKSGKAPVQESYQLCKQNVYDLFGPAQPSQGVEVKLQCVVHEPSTYDF